MTRKLTVLLMTLLLVALCVPALAAGTLQDQINAAGTTPTTIKLDQNYKENITIAAGQTITLDLNGYTLNGGTVKETPTITNNGTLTITGEGEVYREDTSTTTTTYYVVKNTGTLTVESGYFHNDSGKPDKWAGTSLIQNIGTASHTAVMNIYGGTFEQQHFGVLKNDVYSEMNITGGTFKTQGGRINNQSYVYAALNYGKLNISDGTFTGSVSTNSYYDPSESVDYVGSTTITGGMFEDAITIGRVPNNENIPGPGQESLSIKGGTFTGKLLISATSKAGISGGHYAASPDEKYVESGLVVKDSDPKAPYHIGADAEAAIASAKAGSTLTVLKGSAITNVPAGVKVENKTGDKITVNNEPVAPGGEIVIPTPTAAPQPTAKPVPVAPKTGDSTPITLYVLCAALAVACAVWMVRRKANA